MFSGLNNFNAIARPLAIRSIAAASITNAYQLVGALFGQGIVWLEITSTLDQAVMVSLDGSTDFIAVPAGNTVPVFIPINLKANGAVIPGQYGIYVKEIGNPAAGSLYVSVLGVE